MATTGIEAVRQLHTVPLVSIHHPVFAHHYEDGLAHALCAEHESSGPLHDLYLVDMFTLARRFQLFDPHHEQDLFRQIGFALGEIHGRVLLPTGRLRPDTPTLVTFSDEDMRRGYHAGREYFFTEADTQDAWHMTDTSLIERLRELDQEYATYEDPLATVRFNIGCKLGQLSGHLFPWTNEEQRAVDEESIRLLGCVCRINPQSLAARQQCFVPAVS